MTKNNITMTVIIGATFALASLFYPHVPDQIASHWNSAGEVNGYMSKFWGLFLTPFISLGLAGLFILIPNIDPLKNNLAAMRSTYDLLVSGLLGFLLFVQGLIVAWNVGIQFNMTLVIVLGVALLFYFLASILEKTKRNWFVGIRTPWTLQSDAVWDKTHALGGKLFRVTSIIMLLGVFFIDHLVWIILVPTIGTSVYLFYYSYKEYKKEKEGT